MNKLVYDYELRKWKKVGNHLAPERSLVSPITGSFKRTLDMFAIGYYAYGIIDQYGDVLFHSDTIGEVLGLRPEEFKLEFILENVPDSESTIIKEHVQSAELHFDSLNPKTENATKIRFDYSYRHPRKGLRRILQQIVPFEIIDGQINTFFYVFTDISYLKRGGKNDFAIVDLNNGSPKVVESKLRILEPNPFSKRERQVLECLKNRMSTDEIASTLFLSKNTVYNHKKRMLKKTNNHSTIEMLIESIQKGWV